FELERMFALMERFDSPQNNFPTIHIAGTKGKGSVAAMTAAALQSAGYKTGLYTSPHLEDFRERIQINGEWISGADFVAETRRLQTQVDGLPGLTSYELQTALAFLYFFSQQVDCAVVEVGMGGRLDSTNILTPLVSVITNISYDHTAILGNTLAEIAGEKGGIIKRGVPVASAPQQPEALAKLQEIAQAQQAPFTLIGEDITFELLAQTQDGQDFLLTLKGGEAVTLRTRLLGQHQLENAAVAYAALKLAGQAGLPVDDSAIREGFATVKWPGRFEILPGRPTVVMDGAHNRHSASMLADTVRSIFPDRKVVLVFGASEDKDIAGMFAELLPVSGEIYLVQADHPRATPPETLAELLGESGHPVTLVQPFSAIREILAQYRGTEQVILVTGSLYLVGTFRLLWAQK
ncbi:MAG: bifunctional folylpolyglutamate synthase/dihydrofolate synthase, partial [Anaerolineales bacterium]